jgi:hypothetical protein
LTLGVEVAVAACGFLLGGLLARTLRERRDQRRAGSASSSGGANISAFPVKLGDVVVRRDLQDEAWLSSALFLSESVGAQEEAVAVLFLGSDAGGDRAVYARRGDARALTWLTPLHGEGNAPGGEPAHAIEHEGVRFVRKRRLPVHVARSGEQAPDVGASAVVGEYDGPGVARLIVMAGEREIRVWKGVELGEGEYDILPGGATKAPAF